MIKPLPYQEIGAKFLAERKRALLADTMGLGKTAQAIIACDLVDAKRILVICPAAVRINWQREFARFSDKKRSFNVLLSGKDRFTMAGVTVCSYDMAITPALHKLLVKDNYDVVIFDEAHYLKSRLAKRTLAMLGTRCMGQGGVIKRATYAWALTGTPTPNHPGEIYTLLRAFGIWQTNYFDFEAKFCQTKPGDYGPVVIGTKNIPELKALVYPVMLRRKKEDVLTDLPSITYSNVVVSAHDISHADYVNEWEQAEKSKDGQLVRAVLDAAKSPEDVDLSEIALPTLRRATGMAKVRPVCELVMRELDAGLDKIIIFGLHRMVLEETRATLQKYGAQVIYGGNPPAVRQERIDKFVNIWKHRVLIGNLTSLGVGVDGLQKVCSNVLFIESSWTPSDNAQAAMRVHRIGQKRPVLCRFASLADSLDERVQEVIRRKTEMIAQLLD